jgi:hypothetical protein
VVGGWGRIELLDRWGLPWGYPTLCQVGPGAACAGCPRQPEFGHEVLPSPCAPTATLLSGVKARPQKSEQQKSEQQKSEQRSRGSTEQGSTEQGSTEQGSTEQGSTEQGSTEQGSRPESRAVGRAEQQGEQDSSGRVCRQGRSNEGITRELRSAVRLADHEVMW